MRAHQCLVGLSCLPPAPAAQGVAVSGCESGGSIRHSSALEAESVTGKTQGFSIQVGFASLTFSDVLSPRLAEPTEQTWQLPALAVPGLSGKGCSLETHLGKFPSTGLGGGGLLV